MASFHSAHHSFPSPSLSLSLSPSSLLSLASELPDFTCKLFAIFPSKFCFLAVITTSSELFDFLVLNFCLPSLGEFFFSAVELDLLLLLVVHALGGSAVGNGDTCIS
jgi:hypothetical protein